MFTLEKEEVCIFVTGDRGHVDRNTLSGCAVEESESKL